MGKRPETAEKTGSPEGLQEGNMARILIVEDNAEMRMMMMALLGTKGHEIIEAIDGTDVLRWALEEEPDLVLMDVMMPIVGGLEACRQIRAQAETNEIPIIMVTTRGEANNVEAGYESGCNDYVTKPVDGAELLTKIENLIG